MKAGISNDRLTNYGSLLKRIAKDHRLMATHVSLFTAMFIQWQRGGFVSPFPITRRELMGNSKIASVATYHKCIKQLDEFGYLRYQPSYHPHKGSLVYWATDFA